MILALATAFATESTGYAGTFFLPEARARDAGELVVAAGTAMGAYAGTETCLKVDGQSGCGGPFFDVVAAPLARVAWSPSPGTRLEAYGGAALDGTGTVIVDGAASLPVSPVWRVGAFAGVFTEWYGDGRVDGAWAVGLNCSGQWAQVRFDAALPVLGGGLVDGTLSTATLAASEAAVSFDVGNGHAVRAGMLSLLPGGGWQYAGERVVARVDLHTLGVVSAARAEVGARF